MIYEFNANHSTVATVCGTATLEDLESEQGMYSATPEFCNEHGGPIAKSLLQSVPESYLNEARSRGLYPNIDVRVHRLYEGNYPAYPGWHCDAQHRETYFGQPKPDQTKLSNHLIATVSSHTDGISLTQFIDEPVEINLPESDPNEKLWKKVDAEMRKIGDWKTWTMPDGKLTQFDCWTLHRCVPASKRGWRLFFRVAMWYRPNLEQGKLSKQEMIYMDIEQATGW